MVFARIPAYRFTINLAWCGNTYGVAPCTAAGAVGSECYHSWRSCQDKNNFTKTSKPVRFVTAGAPTPASEQSRPYIIKVDPLPTEVDPHKGLAVRASATIVCRDEPCPDNALDPYHATRAVPAGGTYWSRLLARFHYSNLPATLERAYFTGGWDEAEFVAESYIVEAITQSSNGEVTIKIKDLLQLSTTVLVPPTTPGKLAALLNTNDLQLTLGTGQGSYYASSGFVRVGDQIIRYTAKAGDVLSWPDSTYRSQFGTTAVQQQIGDGVQQCEVLSGRRVHQVVQRLCNASGIADANIDLAGNEADDDQWLGVRYEVNDVCLSEPTKVATYLEEIALHTGGVIWLDPVDQKVKYRYIGPQSPAALTSSTLTRAANLIDGQTRVAPQDAMRLTRASVFYSLVTATSNAREGKNYLRPVIYIDASAESANEYGDVRDQVIYSRWFNADNDLAMQGFIARRVGAYRDAPANIECKVDAKDAAIREGELYDVTTAQLVGMDGTARPVRCLVVRRKDNGSGLDLTLRTTTFSRRYGFIAPNGTADYPNNGGYACICLNTGKFADGADGYRII